jgi:hypothetical protein
MMLDKECRLAAIEPSIMPSTLVLLQAVLGCPPTRWKKHSLPSLARQVRKLVSEANARFQERVQLARLATWGKAESTGPSLGNLGKLQVMPVKESSYKSYREVVTPTGKLSEGEIEIIECFEAIQALESDCEGGARGHSLTVTVSDTSLEGFPHLGRIQAGPPLTEFHGRTAFILAFAAAMEVEVSPDPKDSSKKETVSAMFCGDNNEPLLIQRIGKARKEGKELATAGGATSGATSVPSLGYVQRSRCKEEQMLMEAAEMAVSVNWEGGLTMPIPLPPAGIQWEIPGGEEHVTRSAKLVDDGSGKKAWRFAIGGIKVEAFDARPVISSCALSLDDESHPPVPLEGTERYELLRKLLYVDSESCRCRGKEVLESMAALHSVAEADRNDSNGGLNEGIVYDWMPLATKSLLPSRTWRDVLLAIRTRDIDHVVLGKGICPDGTGKYAQS